MGCFSFMCKECGKPILSNSFRGQRVKLFLLKKGKVAEEMEGEYDSYGRVFIDASQREDVEHSLMDSKEWEIDWSDVCDLMFDHDKSNGIAAIHSKCFTGEIPVTRSEDDPNQGWGEDGKYFGDHSYEQIL